MNYFRKSFPNSAEMGNFDRIEMGLYAAEDKFGKTVVLDDSTIDPAFSPKVYDEEGRFAISLTHLGREYIVVELMTFS